MKCNYYILLGIALTTLPASLQAQKVQPKDTTMNRTVVVEQEYNPDIMDASKVNVLPKVEEPAVSKKQVEYATTLFPATSIPNGLMQAYTGKEVQSTSKPGYARVGYGNYNNLDLKANYLFRLSQRDKLHLNLDMNGMSGNLDMPYGESKTWDAYYYRTRANLDYTHQFNKLDLNVAGNFGLSNFNYIPGSLNSKQKFTSGDMYAGVKSTDETLPLQFSAGTNLMLYQRQHDFLFDKSLQETLVRTQAGVTGVINDEQQVSIALGLNNFFYNGDNFENYTALELNPYYELNNDSWKLHLGAHVDMAFGFGKGFRVSPDIMAQYVFSDSYVLYAKATGGKQFNDFRRLERICPYGSLSQIDPENTIDGKQLEDTYEQINTALGFKTSPFPGVWFNLYAGYQNLKDDAFYKNTSYTITNTGTFPYLVFDQTNSHNTYAGAEVNYDYKDIISLSVSGIYRSWKADLPVALLAKPVGELKFNVSIHPIAALTLNVGYEYISREKVEEYDRMAAISNLYLGVGYKLFKGISIYARANNLMNKDYQYYLGYPTEGLNFLGGLSFQF